ncbi:MAG TPA: AGE family epimerase/isomerase [Devosiaceae bacterium]|nr:AGE family epimerase/isomerase [Devosiaceae bacterium]
MENAQLNPAGLGNWQSRTYHRQWLMQRADELFDYFQYRAVHATGGFIDLDPHGKPINPENPVRPIHGTARMVHCFAIASLLGRPGADEIVDHGMRFLWERHRDPQFGGYLWSLDNDGPRDDTKQGYGHAFVLLAASSAKVVGHPLADRMLADITEILDTRFWEERHGAIAEEFSRDWVAVPNYRGQNSNMHLTEALMAAFEATGDKNYLDKAQSIAKLIIHDRAGELGFRVAEHFDADWQLDLNYQGSEMFRPSGATPGHWLEWARLTLQLWILGGKVHDWMPGAAASLFRNAIELGWDKDKGGFFYTLDWNNKPIMRSKLWWPMAEGAGAAAFLNAHQPDAFHEEWYRRIWGGIAQNFLDHENGGWFEELSEDLLPSHKLFAGKADIYHALQACLIPLFPATGSLTKVIPEAGAKY